MSVNYFDFVGKTYESLVREASFTSLIRGNVPSKISGLDSEFFIKSDQYGVELHFDQHSRQLKLIVVSNPDYFYHHLKGLKTMEEIRQFLGDPIESMPEKKVPVLGNVGAWDKFKLQDAQMIQVLYEVGNHNIRCVYFS
ncbi:hypothetical protein [Vibrio rhizosphaerae]|uniref:hypothetical protein n=1 Tax=Vibrio rhizosphaerae TaxID=398736 RepID=UPI000570847F|nr:hypothetical protein [Vibrio rhizosphaerae]